MIQAIADATVNAGLSEAWLLKVLLDEKNRGGEKIQELARKKGEREAQRYVAMVYRNARKFVAAHPPFGRRPDVLAKIDEIERGAASDTERWKGPRISQFSTRTFKSRAVARASNTAPHFEKSPSPAESTPFRP